MTTSPRLFLHPASLLAVALILLGVACSSGGSKTPPAVTDTPIEPTPTAGTSSGSGDEFLIGKPQNRPGLGDVQQAFDRYESTRKETIDLFKQQGWFKDGLSREESLFVERSLTFLASYSNGGRRVQIPDETIRRALFKYETVPVVKGEVELLLVYRPGDDASREMSFLKRALPALESIVGVEYPSRVMVVINGNFETNDYNDGQFIRIADCCTQSGFVLAHEMAHSYWSMGPSWFNEGMADIYSQLTLARLKSDPPAGWGSVGAENLDSWYRGRKQVADAARSPSLTITKRFASDGLYEVADVFLMDIRRAIGEENFAVAVREIYLTSDFGRYNLREKRIQDLFMAQAKSTGARDEVMTLFNKVVWGDNGERYKRLQELEGS